MTTDFKTNAYFNYSTTSWRSGGAFNLGFEVMFYKYDFTDLSKFRNIIMNQLSHG